MDRTQSIISGGFILSGVAYFFFTLSLLGVKFPRPRLPRWMRASIGRLKAARCTASDKCFCRYEIGNPDAAFVYCYTHQTIHILTHHDVLVLRTLARQKERKSND